MGDIPLMDKDWLFYQSVLPTAVRLVLVAVLLCAEGVFSF